MQNVAAGPPHRRELNTLTWVGIIGALIALGAALFLLQQQRQKAQPAAPTAR